MANRRLSGDALAKWKRQVAAEAASGLPPVHGAGKASGTLGKAGMGRGAAALGAPGREQPLFRPCERSGCGQGLWLPQAAGWEKLTAVLRGPRSPLPPAGK